jgi:hypothetical protein
MPIESEVLVIGRGIATRVRQNSIISACMHACMHACMRSMQRGRYVQIHAGDRVARLRDQVGQVVGDEGADGVDDVPIVHHLLYVVVR